ncbi:MAG: NADH-quinone oxidoreductase subunit C [Actinomycetota bacterium]
MTSWVGEGDWLERARSLRADGWWLADLTALDRLSLGGDLEHRFEVVVQLLHKDRKERMTVHVPASGDPPTVPSVTPLWPGANFFEREVFDLFGVRFDGHPDLTRIMMPDEWEGHPLRKDYGVGKVPVDFLPQPFLQVDGPRQAINAGEAGVDVDHLGQLGPARRHKSET